MPGPGPYGNKGNALKPWQDKAKELSKKRGGQWVCFEDGSCRRKRKLPKISKAPKAPTRWV